MKKGGSKYTEYFNKVGEEGICKYCNRCGIPWKGGSTKSLIHHLKNCDAYQKSIGNSNVVVPNQPMRGRPRMPIVPSQSARASRRRRGTSPVEERESRQESGQDNFDNDDEMLPRSEVGRAHSERTRARDFLFDNDEDNGLRRKRIRGQDEPGPSNFGRSSPLFDEDEFADNISEYRPSNRIHEERYRHDRTSSDQRVVPYHNSPNFEMDDDAIKEENKAILNIVFDGPMPVRVFLQAGINSYIRRYVREHRFPTKKILFDEALPAVSRDIRSQIENQLSMAHKISASIHVYSPPNDSKQKIVAIHAFYTLPTFKPCKLLIHFSVDEETEKQISKGLKRLMDKSNPEERVKKIRFLMENLSPIDDSFERVTYNEVFEEALKIPCLDQLLTTTFRAFTTNLPKEWMTVIAKQKQVFRENLPPFKELDNLLNIFLATEGACWKQHMKLVVDVLKIYSEKSVSDRKNCLSNEEYQLTKLMEILYNEAKSSVEHFQYEGHLPVSATIPIMRSLIEKIRAQDVPFQRQRQWLQHILPQFEEIYTVCCKHDTLRLATFLDPRFKNVYFSEHYIVTKKNFERDVKPTTTNPADESTEREKAALPGYKLVILNQKIPQQKSQQTPQQENQQTPQQESQQTPQLDSFDKELLIYENLHHSENSTPSEFWKMQEINLPILSNLAKDYLHLPAMSTGAEELFAAGEVMLPLEKENRQLHEKLVFCFGNKNLIRN
ncbi:unnamed protein product [Caenorhabditis brenneri]